MSDHLTPLLALHIAAGMLAMALGALVLAMLLAFLPLLLMLSRRWRYRDRRGRVIPAQPAGVRMLSNAWMHPLTSSQERR